MTDHDPRHDFDFFNGTWTGRHRQLKDRLSGCNEWTEFESRSWVKPLAGGAAQIDQFSWESAAQPVYGITLRLYDPVADQWSMNWADNSTGRLFPPMIGRFRDGVGVFGGTDTCRGESVLSRFTWFEITPTSATWEQAFSGDAGLTWETNWRTEFTRIIS